MDWDKLRTFYAVADAGGVTRGSEVLNLSQSAVSRQITALEEELGIQLFRRHARGLVLTEQGETLYGAVEDVNTRLEEAEEQLTASHKNAEGVLRVTTTVTFGSTWLAPRLKKLYDQYPDIRIELLLHDEELDLAHREADVAIRFGAPVQPYLIRRRLRAQRFHVYAAPEYIEARGAPTREADLDDHRIITYGHPIPAALTNVNYLEWAGHAGRQNREPLLRINNIYGVLRAIESGLGLGLLPDYLARTRPGLLRVLNDITEPGMDIYLVYTEDLRASKRVSVFRDFLLEQVREDDADEEAGNRAT